jgi:hypothetical protein
MDDNVLAAKIDNRGVYQALRVKRSKNACAGIEFTGDMLYNASWLDKTNYIGLKS